MCLQYFLGIFGFIEIVLFKNHAKPLSMLFPELIGFLEAFDKARVCEDMDTWA